MSAFLYGVALQCKIDFRNKGVLLTYYIVPLVFFAFMGGIFTSINSEAKETLIQSMTIFGVTMGAILGSPVPLTELYGSEIKKSYKVGNIPLYIPAINNFLSALIHLLLMSTIIFFTAPLAFQAEIPANIFAYFVSLILFIKVSLAIGTVLGLMVQSTSKLTMISQFIFLPSLMLSGIMFPTEMLPRILEYIGSVLPATLGFQLMKSSVFDWKIALPLMFTFIVFLFLSYFKLIKLEKE